MTKNHIHAAELPELISTVHASLAGMGSAPMAEPEPDKLVPPVSIKKSITEDYLISLEDGKHYRSLKRHLSVRGMTPDEYRAKWGCPETIRWSRQPMQRHDRNWRRALALVRSGGRGDALAEKER